MQTQLFLCVSVTRETWNNIFKAAASYHFRSHIFLSISWSFWEICSECRSHKRYLITKHRIFLYIFNQVTSSAVLSSLLPALSAGLLCFSSVLSFNNRLMWSISSSQLFHSNLNLHDSAQVWWDTFPHCCTVLYYRVCDLAWFDVHLNTIGCMCNASGFDQWR